jgi:hypothetical protein
LRTPKISARDPGVVITGEFCAFRAGLGWGASAASLSAAVAERFNVVGSLYRAKG